MPIIIESSPVVYVIVSSCGLLFFLFCGFSFLLFAYNRGHHPIVGRPLFATFLALFFSFVFAIYCLFNSIVDSCTLTMVSKVCSLLLVSFCVSAVRYAQHVLLFAVFDSWSLRSFLCWFSFHLAEAKAQLASRPDLPVAFADQSSTVLSMKRRSLTAATCPAPRNFFVSHAYVVSPWFQITVFLMATLLHLIYPLFVSITDLTCQQDGTGQSLRVSCLSVCCSD